jgi:hypothetical protein
MHGMNTLWEEGVRDREGVDGGDGGCMGGVCRFNFAKWKKRESEEIEEEGERK